MYIRESFRSLVVTSLRASEGLSGSNLAKRKYVFPFLFFFFHFYFVIIITTA